MCGSKPQTVVYTHNMKERKVNMKTINVLNKWAAGAIARRKFKRIISTKMIGGKCYHFSADPYLFRAQVPHLQRKRAR